MRAYAARLVSLVSLSLVLGSACAFPVRGSGRESTKEAKVSSFDSVSAGGGIELLLRRGPNKVVLTMDDNLHERFEARSEGGTLRLGFKPGVSILGFSKVRAEVWLPELEKLSASGATRVEAEDMDGDEVVLELSGGSSYRGRISCEELGLELSGASKAEIEFSAELLGAKVSGASELALEGRTEKAAFDLSGASRLEAEGLAILRASVEASGASRGTISVGEELEAKLSGASSLRYRGDPRREVDTSGGSGIERIGG